MALKSIPGAIFAERYTAWTERLTVSESTFWSQFEMLIKKPKIMRHMEAKFQCAGCGEWNSTTVDESAGREQSYVEDCQVCCKPNVLQVHYDPSAQEFFLTAELE
jgi:hypothetical protein